VIGRTHRRFWNAFEKLPAPIQDLAREKYAMWKGDPFHPSLGFEERRNNVCVVRIGDHYRHVACEKLILFCGFGLARTKITTGFGSNCVSSGPRVDALDPGRSTDLAKLNIANGADGRPVTTGLSGSLSTASAPAIVLPVRQATLADTIVCVT
jgi:hypothetical protein